MQSASLKIHQLGAAARRRSTAGGTIPLTKLVPASLSGEQVALCEWERLERVMGIRYRARGSIALSAFEFALLEGAEAPFGSCAKLPGQPSPARPGRLIRVPLIVPRHPSLFIVVTASRPEPSDLSGLALIGDPMTTLEKFADLPAPIAAALAQRGFESLTSVQRAVVDAEAGGRDLRISSQTGSGKTVAIGLALAATCFLPRDHDPRGGLGSCRDEERSRGEKTGRLPRGPRPRGPASDARGAAHPVALIIVPTRELAAQLREELRWLYANLAEVSVEVVTGGTSVVMEQRALARRPSLVVGTPGRLIDHMERGALVCDEIQHVVLDEADQMLDMGFREELEAILEKLPEQRSSHLVSATFPRAVQTLANQFQRNALMLEGTRLGAANSDILHIAHAIRCHETYAALVNVLLFAGEARCLLFVNRRIDATALAEKLSNDGFAAAPFSGELPQAQRTRTLAAFRNGSCPILVSTDVAARGIDVPDIGAVIHVDPPRTGDAYVHRSGRTGRAGRTGKSILLVVAQEMRQVQRMLRYAKIEVSWQPVPSPEKVRKAHLKQARRQLHARLADEEPSESQVLYAKQLLEGRDPAQVVATLIEMTKAEPAREPMRVDGIDPFVDDRPRRRGPRGFKPKAGDDRRPRGFKPKPYAGRGPKSKGKRPERPGRPAHVGRKGPGRDTSR